MCASLSPKFQPCRFGEEWLEALYLDYTKSGLERRHGASLWLLLRRGSCSWTCCPDHLDMHGGIPRSMRHFLRVLHKLAESLQTQ